MSVPSRTAGLLVAGSAVILTGDWLPVVSRALCAAQERRRRNGLPPGHAYTELSQVITSAIAASGQTDLTKPATAQHRSGDEPTVDIAEAARRLRVDPRHARRLAKRLGGTKVKGKWLLDADAITEHLEGQQK